MISHELFLGTAGSLGLVTRAGASHRPHHYPSYKISKAALNVYTRTLAEELRDRQITVSSIHPGWVKTDMGGPQGERTPEQAAEALLAFALSHPSTGQFWFAGKRFFGKRVPW
jgi:NAD(P)-dependent dehydrogenase (short-subunit alcohol dehydrogenase family)